MALIHAMKEGEDPAVNRWHGVLTIIVKGKGIFSEDGSPWVAGGARNWGRVNQEGGVLGSSTFYAGSLGTL